MTATQNPPRTLTAEELGALVKVYRELRKWSQEQLAAIANISTRTVQRVENGKSCDLDTKRALARAFEFEDIDVLNKPLSIPTDEELAKAKADFEREHLTLKAYPVSSGRELGVLVTKHMLDLSTPGFDMERESEETFAALVDYLHDYRDIASEYAETQKLEVYDDLQGYIDTLLGQGVSLRYGERKVKLALGGPPEAARPMDASVLYLVTFHRGQEPEEFATPRKFRIG